ncbi:hypothetical protein BC629DRAFT_1537567 [Irpex lacteus]|nr:hypothetical protein BC629DRAFT_1537567 [Irpex lacteus]
MTTTHMSTPRVPTVITTASVITMRSLTANNSSSRTIHDSHDDRLTIALGARRSIVAVVVMALSLGANHTQD